MEQLVKKLEEQISFMQQEISQMSEEIYTQQKEISKINMELINLKNDEKNLLSTIFDPIQYNCVSLFSPQ